MKRSTRVGKGTGRRLWAPLEVRMWVLWVGHAPNEALLEKGRATGSLSATLGTRQGTIISQSGSVRARSAPVPFPIPERLQTIIEASVIVLLP